jgi:GNAT superfamily N-acetyltransferase
MGNVPLVTRVTINPVVMASVQGIVQSWFLLGTQRSAFGTHSSQLAQCHSTMTAFTVRSLSSRKPIMSKCQGTLPRRAICRIALAVMILRESCLSVVVVVDIEPSQQLHTVSEKHHWKLWPVVVNAAFTTSIQSSYYHCLTTRSSSSTRNGRKNPFDSHNSHLTSLRWRSSSSDRIRIQSPLAVVPIEMATTASTEVMEPIEPPPCMNATTVTTAATTTGFVSTECAVPQRRQRLASLRIRQTMESDLPIVAQFLTLAQQPKRQLQQRQPPSLSLLSPLNDWKNRIDALFAQSDIEGLIRRRWDTIQEGRKARLRALSKLEIAAYQDTTNGSTPSTLWQEQDQTLLQLLWSTQSDRLRSRIAAAAAETGEDSVWRHVTDRMYCTPSSWHWLQHVQLTATTTTTTTVTNDDATIRTTDNQGQSTAVGFCEIAMLEYPVMPAGNNEWHAPNWMIVVDRRAEDHSLPSRNRRFDLDSSPSTVCFAPAIANLAVAPTARRRGIASQLLRSAERYVATYWQSKSNNNGSTMPLALGLYVEQDNVAALSLYTACGYRTVQSIPGRNGQCDMWYMSKTLERH